MDVFSTGNLGGLLIGAIVLSALLFAGVVVGSALTLANMEATMTLARIGAIVCIIAGFLGLFAVTGLLIAVLYRWKPVGNLLFDLYREQGVAYLPPEKPLPIIIQPPMPKDVRRNVNIDVKNVDKLREKLLKKKA